MNTTSRILALCLALAPLACTTTVVGGGSGGGSSTTSTGTSIGTGPCGPAPGEPTTPTGPAPTAIALLASQINASSGAGGGSSTATTGSGGGVDPNTLYVMIGSPAPVCSDPFGASAQCGTYAITIGIPPQLQQPGTLNLSDTALISTFSETGTSSTAGVCPGGGGSFVDGTIDIVSIDATQVVFTLTGTMMFAGEGIPDEVANGTYTASRCP